MSELVEIINHKGHEIILVKCAEQDEPNILLAFDEMLDTVLASKDPKKALVLVDMTNTFSSMTITKKGREIADRGKRQGLPDLPTAIIGFTGAQKTVAKMFSIIRQDDTLLIADTMEDAKEWLIGKLK